MSSGREIPARIRAGKIDIAGLGIRLEYLAQLLGSGDLYAQG
jgi:hypothetical protein